MPPLTALSRRAAVALAALATLAPAAGAKKRKKKKKCPTCVPLPLGSRCSTASQCCGTETNLSCAVTESGIPSGTVCCGTSGVACTSNDDCCSGFQCGSSVCAPKP